MHDSNLFILTLVFRTLKIVERIVFQTCIPVLFFRQGELMTESSKSILRNFDTISACTSAMSYHASKVRNHIIEQGKRFRYHRAEYLQIQMLRDYIRFAR